VDAKKMGPAFKEVAVKYKGKSEAALFADWKSIAPHSVVKASDADVKAVLKWVMTLK
jgi:cytochrome c551/c552